MKTINNNTYKIIKNKKTYEQEFILDPTSQTIEYTDKELETLVDAKLIPKDIAKVGIKQINKMKKDFEDWIIYKKNNPKCSKKDHMEWFKERVQISSSEDLKKEIAFMDYMLKNINKLQQALDNKSNPKTFAIPSHPLMFALLALFAGKPERIPKKILEKPHNERTPEEKKAAEKYLSKIFEKKQKTDYSTGEEKIHETQIALICNNPKVEGKAEIASIFQKNILFREERLAIYIKRTFGPEGIRHLLGLIIGLEENGRTGNFEWSVDEHLTRLGYKRKNNGSFDPELKKMASEVVKIFTGLCITSTRKEGKKESFNADYLFMVGGFKIEKSIANNLLEFEEIIKEKIKLVATDCWYKNAMYPQDGQSPKYTKLLKEIVKENHRENPLTLYLAPLLAIFWRINPERKFKIQHLMEWCDLETKGKHVLDQIRDLESTLEYMKAKNYLGDWKNNNNNEIKFPSQCKKPLECVITLTPPDWLKQEFTAIQKKTEKSSITTSSKKISQTQFLEILNSSGLSRKQFANSIGVSSRLITAIINNKRTITDATTKKIDIFLNNRNKNALSTKV